MTDSNDLFTLKSHCKTTITHPISTNVIQIKTASANLVIHSEGKLRFGSQWTCFVLVFSLVLCWPSVTVFTACSFSLLSFCHFLFSSHADIVQITHLLLGGRRLRSMMTVTVWRGKRTMIRCCYGRISPTTTCPTAFLTTPVPSTATETHKKRWL